MPAAEPHRPLDLPMAYPPHMGKAGPPPTSSRPGPPHQPIHPPPGSYGPPPGPPQVPSHPGYSHNGPPVQRGPSGPHLQNGSQSQLGAASQPGRGPLGPSGAHLNHPGLDGQRGPPGPVGGPGPHKYIPPNVPHAGGQRPHPDGPLGDPRQPPAYPEPPRYPGPHVIREDGEGKHPTHGPGPAAKQYSGPGAAGELARLEEELAALGRSELLSRVLHAERELLEVKHSAQAQGGELRHLRETHQRLTDDNQELRDLCCFLDDDRQKGRKLAREWQRFGRYTASVMRQEVTAYQNKLRELDAKQQELIKDNLELKELCLYLDEERSNASCGHCGNPLLARDDGDGSSSSTNADEPSGPPAPAPPTTTAPQAPQPPPLARSSSRERLLEDSLGRQRLPMNEQVLSYIRSLETRVLVLEADKQKLGEELGRDSSRPEGEGHDPVQEPCYPPGPVKDGGKYQSRPAQPPPYSLSHHMRAVGLGLTTRTALGPGSAESDDDLLDRPPPLVSRPTSVAAAMRVLEVQEQLEGVAAPSPGPLPPPPPQARHAPPSTDAALADGEKALLRQMCSVVWKKLEEVPSQNR